MSIGPTYRADEGTISRVVKSALDRKVLSEQQPTAVFFDMYGFERRLKDLSKAFPAPALNAVAIKANPVVNILKVAAENGFGAECASKGELLIAKKAGFPSDKIVYDSPTKTAEEIRHALTDGIFLNIDNEQELGLVGLLARKGLPARKNSIGLRINPELSFSDFEQPPNDQERRTITGLRSSKFGVPISRARQLLTGHGGTKKLITGLHVHIGSQRCPVPVIIKGIKRVVELAEVLNGRYGFSITTIDIGGGLAIHYKDDDVAVSFQEFSDKISSAIPKIADYRVVTEFGRAVSAYAGWVATRVEYTKEVRDENGGKLRIAAIQVGGDMFVRTAYMDWYHEILALNGDGSIKSERPVPHDVAGPLCFSGDFIGHKRMLPPIKPHDWVVIRDSGAYTFGMWSHYNSRAFPPIYGYDERLNLSVLHRGHTSEEMASFWECAPEGHRPVP